MNTVYTNTLISTLLMDNELPNGYSKHPERYFVPFSDKNAKKYVESHLKDNDTGYIPGVVLLKNKDKQILNFEHETADIISTWIELLSLTKSCIEDSQRLTFIMDSPYRLKLDKNEDSFVLTVDDQSGVNRTENSYSLHKNSYLQGILEGASATYNFFENIDGLNIKDLEELKDNIIFFKGDH